jgi:hypothetical protein
MIMPDPFFYAKIFPTTQKGHMEEPICPIA